MTAGNYEKSIIVASEADDAYKALTSGYSQWWTPCDGAFNKLGDRITFRFLPQVSCWTFEARKLAPNQYVTLECVEAHHVILEKPSAPKSEWLGSFLRFKIESIGNQVRVELVHEGLTPQKQCYEVCEAGWDHFFLNSLQKYLNTGVGEPHGS